MTSPIVKIRISELLDALEFVSSSASFDSSAFIDRETGAIHYRSSEVGVVEEIPDDIETSDRYVAVPRKNDLNLGRELVLSFAEQELPADYETVCAFFRKKGAYARFKDFLARRNLLERWYAYESRETEAALRLWCRDNAIEIADEAAGG